MTAGWQPDPTGHYELRYWDGSAWTEHVSNRGVTSTAPLVDANVNAGWQRDPTGRHELRYWDGSAWTEYVSDGGATSTDPLAGAAATSGSAERHSDRLPTRGGGDGPVVHPLDAAQRVSAFPRAGDSFDLGGVELPILVERDELPADAVDMATFLVASASLEPTERRVAAACRIVADSIRAVLAATFPTKADAVNRWLASGSPDFDGLRTEFTDVDRGVDLVDFELIKLLAVLSSPASPIRELG